MPSHRTHHEKHIIYNRPHDAQSSIMERSTILVSLPFPHIWSYHSIAGNDPSPESGKAHPVAECMYQNHAQQAAGT
jgi:hypothetical protein